MKKNLLYFVIILVFFASANVSAQFAPLDLPLLKLGFDYQHHQLIMQFINYHQRRGRSKMEIGLARSGQLSRMAQRIFREEKVPEDLVWIAQITSLWNFDEGLWQFDQSIAQKYELQRTKYLDERKSFEKATRVMAQHLKFLSEKYNESWELSLAAYFSGEKVVDRAIRLSKSKNFWLAYPYLPSDTRNFVPNVLATILIADNKRIYGFENIQADQPLLYDLIRVPPSLSLDLIAQFSDSNFENIKHLNPELISITTPPRNYIIRIPLGKTNIFIERIHHFLQDKKIQRK